MYQHNISAEYWIIIWQLFGSWKTISPIRSRGDSQNRDMWRWFLIQCCFNSSLETTGLYSALRSFLLPEFSQWGHVCHHLSSSNSELDNFGVISYYFHFDYELLVTKACSGLQSLILKLQILNPLNFIISIFPLSFIIRCGVVVTDISFIVAIFQVLIDKK